MPSGLPEHKQGIVIHIVFSLRLCPDYYRNKYWEGGDCLEIEDRRRGCYRILTRFSISRH